MIFFFGCLFIAYGPAAALFFMIVAKKAQLVIVSVSSAFCWLVSIMFAATIWFIIPPLRDSYGFFLPIGVLFQEVGRYVFFRLYHKAESSFSVVATNGVLFPMTDLSSALAAGLGFGLTHSVLMYGSVLAAASGPGTLYSSNCPQMSTFTLSALNSLWYTLSHVCWMIVAFDGFRRQSLLGIFYVVFAHLLASLLTLLNLTSNGCVVSLPLEFVLLLINFGVTVYCTHRPDYRSKLRNL
eukprot:TRINITY_DN9482_c0_g1_i2.p1 TRINITY_DN9482_c0_g1~~TRINITY_DN9482_c0_g1_i2.p1  ORF type:complete len:239 (-),score=50.84 TRINITY_DN9482_c0_g1_i2:21-737(-)